MRGLLWEDRPAHGWVLPQSGEEETHGSTRRTGGHLLTEDRIRASHRSYLGVSFAVVLIEITVPSVPKNVPQPDPA